MHARRSLLLGFLLALILSGSAEAAHPPVVMLVFDEFPTDTLVRPDGRIDAGRFPGFAALARISTWYPNAASVYDSTNKAVPAILDGKLPRPGGSADLRDHPRNIFTLLGGHGYRMRAYEEATDMCPRRLCRHDRHYGDAVPNILSGRRRARLERTIRGIHRTKRPTFTFHHSLLPHVPWTYLPSGHVQPVAPLGALPDFKTPPGFHDVFLTHHNEQRHLLQVGFVDREVGRLVRRLRRTRLLRRSMIVVTADHGLSWQIGVDDRRTVTESNVHEVATVPLFVKRPGQRRGRTSRAFARTIDILPTVASALGLRLEGPVDGRPVWSAGVRARRGIRIARRDLSGDITISAGALASRRRGERLRRARLFGTGSWSPLFRIGPHRGLLGRRAATLAVRAGAVRASFAVPTRNRVSLRGKVAPTWAGGRLSGGTDGASRDLALAVDGVVAAVGRSFHLTGRSTEFFSLVVPESALRRGRNRFELFEVSEGRGGAALAPLGAVGP